MITPRTNNNCNDNDFHIENITAFNLLIPKASSTFLAFQVSFFDLSPSKYKEKQDLSCNCHSPPKSGSTVIISFDCIGKKLTVRHNRIEHLSRQQNKEDLAAQRE